MRQLTSGAETTSASGDGAVPGFRLVQLTGSFEGFGVAMDYLSRRPPFAGHDVGNFAAAIRLQLASGRHVAALNGLQLVGYCGWLTTLSRDAELWTQGRGPLPPVDDGDDAVALTTLAADDRRILTALIRHARDLNPGAKVYFKREYADGRRAERKTSIVNQGKRPSLLSPSRMTGAT